MVRAVYPALAVVHDQEWDDDYALERAALATIGVGLIRGDELREDMVSSVVALLTAGTRVTEHDLGRYPRLRVVSEFGTGYDGIDLDAAGRLGISVTNVSGYCTEEVADHTLALALGLVRRVQSLVAQARDGRWAAVDTGSVRRSADSTWGIVGFAASAGRSRGGPWRSASRCARTTRKSIARRSVLVASNRWSSTICSAARTWSASTPRGPASTIACSIAGGSRC
jgi:hypothetical protein